MTFLSPWTALVAAALALPLLLLLYFLKLRRRSLRLASTLLWQRSFEDLQVNVPFQRLRTTLLFLLQLLLLLLLLLAFAEPVLVSATPLSSRIILLIDRSASMNARDAGAGEPSRLDAAREEAKRIVRDVTVGSRQTEVMLIAFGAGPQLISSFESRRDLLLAAIDSIAPTHEVGDLDAALQLAGALASRREDGADDPPDVILISDGGVQSPDDHAGFMLRAGRFRFIPVGPGAGEAVENAGIVALSARRDRNDPGQVLVFARLINAGSAPVQSLLSLSVNDHDGPVESVTLEPAGWERDRRRLGEATARFAVEVPADAVLRVRQGRRDALPMDDTAAIVLPAPLEPRIALVHDGSGADPFLEQLLKARDATELRVMSIDAYQTIDPLDIDRGRRFDLVVFDDVPPPRLPGVPSITFGAIPPGLEAKPPAEEGGKRILSWPRQHPLMRHVSLDPIVYADFGALELPTGATALASGPDGPVIALIPSRGAQHIAVGFDLRHSNWPTHISITVFMLNALEYLTLSRTGSSSIVYAPGEPISVRVQPEVERLIIEGPVEATMDVEGGSLVTLPILRLAGLYRVRGAEPPHDVIAVSLLSEVESDITTRAELVVNAERRTASGSARTAPKALWPWLLGVAMCVLVLEWLAYCLRVRVR